MIRPHGILDSIRSWSRTLPAILLLPASLSTVSCSDRAQDPPESAGYDQERYEEALVGIETWLGKGKPEEAELIARRLVELEPESTEALEAHARCLMVLAALRQHEGDEAEARSLKVLADERYTAALLHAGETPSVSLLHEAGISATGVDDVERALRLHMKAASLDPTGAKHAIFTGNLLARLNRPEEARAWFGKAVAIDEGEPWGWAGLAESHRQDGAFEDALKSIRTARSVAPEMVGFRVAEARILRESGRPRDAAMLLFAIDPEQRATRLVTPELAAACRMMEDHRREAEAWEALHARNPDDLDAMTEVAAAWIRAGDQARAASWLGAAENAGARPEEVQRVRALIREQ